MTPPTDSARMLKLAEYLRCYALGSLSADMLEALAGELRIAERRVREQIGAAR